MQMHVARQKKNSVFVCRDVVVVAHSDALSTLSTADDDEPFQ